MLLPTLAACGGLDTPETQAPNAVTVGTSAEAAAVDAFFGRFIAADTPGAIVLVLRDGEVVYQAAYGVASLETNEPLTTDHIMHIASVGKQMTALGIMLLVQDGELEYDDPVGMYLPELEHFGEAFTIRTLLTHTSGLPDYDDELSEEMLALADEPTNADLLDVLSEWDELPVAPGEEFEYSNPGYDLLGSLIEAVSGMPFPEFMQQRIFEPLGMTNTFSLPDAARRANPFVALSYTDENGEVEAYPSDEFDNLIGSGSIYTTAGDMARYDAALSNGILLDLDALAEAYTPATLNDGSSEAYGFGWELEEWNGEPYVAHSGAWLGFETDYVRLPGLSVLVMLNRNYDIPDEPRLGLQVAALFE
ncbi:MAG: hypothetical protein RLZZ387_4076 [Chloroflexota bacterium]|jgi:CubicO group peptidase (beta-lactamase class C family)